MKRASKNTRKDKALAEFETKDLGEDILRSGSAVVIRPRSRQVPTSILLDPSVIEKLKEKGGKRGIGYQTMLKIIVREHMDEY